MWVEIVCFIHIVLLGTGKRVGNSYLSVEYSHSIGKMNNWAIFATKYLRMVCGKHYLKSLKWYGLLDMVCLSRSYHFKFLKGYLPQISLGPFLNTLSCETSKMRFFVKMINSLPLTIHTSFSGPYFSAFGLSLRIQFEYGKIRTRKTHTEKSHLDAWQGSEQASEEWARILNLMQSSYDVLNMFPLDFFSKLTQRQ